MANLPETPQWEDGIYQIEVSDPVLGGPDGITNRPLKQLASRTLYLKQKTEEGSSSLAAHIAAADPHTQYAPKVSPVLTGTPTAPTAPQTTNNQQIANTAFVKAALAALVASSPAALDTLNELAAALGNDPNFATTMTNALANKQPLDDTLTALSGKTISGLLEYLGLGGIRYVKQRGSNANGKWAIWSDGSVEVFGTSGVGSSGLATVTFPISLPGISHDIAIAERLSSDSTTNVMHVTMVVDSTLTASGFQARSQFANGSPSTFAFSWRVIYAVV